MSLALLSHHPNYLSLRASSPIWASEASHARTQNARTQSRLLTHASHACTFHDIPQMEILELAMIGLVLTLLLATVIT